MIQFNLLPDLKMEYIKARRQKHTLMFTSMLTAATAVTVFVLLFVTVNVFQRTHINDLDRDIKESSNQLTSTEDLNKVLTIQNQLSALPKLHGDKPVTSRVFSYMSQVTPNQVNIGSMTLDFSASKLEITGTTDSIGTINKFVDTLKFTTYTALGNDGSATNPLNKAFKDVVMASFGRTDKDATYQITLNFDKTIFDGSKNVTLNVPKNFITTRSETEKPTDLFKALPQPKAKQ